MRVPECLPGSRSGSVLVVLGFAAAGWAWWDYYSVLVDRYEEALGNADYALVAGGRHDLRRDGLGREPEGAERVLLDVEAHRARDCR